MKLFFIVVLACLGGCATTSEVVPLETQSKTLALVVDVEDEVSLDWIGTTVLNNTFNAQRLPNLRIPDAIERTTRQVLTSAGLSSITRITPSDFKQKAVTTTYDYVLEFKPTRANDVRFGPRGTYLSGIGVYQRSIFNGTPVSKSHVVLEAKLMNGRANQKIDSFWWLESVDGPIFSDKSEAPLTAKQVSKLEANIDTMIGKAVSISIRQLGLTEFVPIAAGR